MVSYETRSKSGSTPAAPQSVPSLAQQDDLTLSPSTLEAINEEGSNEISLFNPSYTTKEFWNIDGLRQITLHPRSGLTITRRADKYSYRAMGGGEKSEQGPNKSRSVTIKDPTLPDHNIESATRLRNIGPDRDADFTHYFLQYCVNGEWSTVSLKIYGRVAVTLANSLRVKARGRGPFTVTSTGLIDESCTS